MLTHHRPSLPTGVQLVALLPERQKGSQPAHECTTVFDKIAKVWRAAPPPRPWVVALGFILMSGMVLVQTYEAGREAGFRVAELSR